MKKYDDNELEDVLRACGAEMRDESERLSVGELARHREQAIRTASRAERSRWSALRAPFLTPRALLPQLAFACVLSLALVFTLQARRNDPVRPSAPAPRVAVSSPIDAELRSAYAALSSSSAWDDEDDLNDDELLADGSLAPEYAALDLETETTEDTEEDDDGQSWDEDDGYEYEI